ncbi:Glycosyl transferase family 11 [Cohaesibacter sp. ES.047]|uniref:alpha-1,2-fucosyltransferase n=1 Tax=Cohaesibacter sp. ES.047 TaxID=1798205 RepID=UPI000BB704BE|nr:alpha-1,2-fucosyltransferase [Cohaesibacter sp. ES.047]SNY90487.1 Glycosyl transferase family 11 [Cohaesibacter sp. ES.047]
MNSTKVKQETVADYLCIRIFGGLGNQMFQYAAAFAQAQRTGSKLLVHAVGSDRLEHANFGLSAFPISADVWEQEETETASLLGKLTGKARQQDRKKKHGGNWPGPRFQHESLTVTDEIHAIKKGTYLAGYFQSEDYFACESDAIRREFSLASLDEALDPGSKARAEQTGSVSVHIRRGDYLYDPKVLKIHGIMEDDYYERARLLMQKAVPDCHFCIFSDDQDAADQLTRDWPNRTLMPEADRMHDLALMTKCSHHIIANSSFSWWGAWLNPNADKLVIAPRRWYTRDHMLTTYIDDICPRGWILV